MEIITAQHLKKRLLTFKQEFHTSFPNIIHLDGAGDKSTPLVTAADLGAEAEEEGAEVVEEAVVMAAVAAVAVVVKEAMAMVSANLKMVLILLTSLVSFMMMNGRSYCTRQGIRFTHVQRGQKQSRRGRTREGKQVQQALHQSQAHHGRA